jgi:group I intron endonuclease
MPAMVEHPGNRFKPQEARMSNSISGIYQIRNTVNGHCYIGSAVNIRTRWNLHKHHLQQNKHHSQYLQRAWNKYGEDCFEFEIIETCFPFILIFREQHYIDLLQPVYNISPKAGSRLGSKVSDEGRLRMKTAQNARTNLVEAHAKQSTSMMGRKRESYTEETKEKMSIAAKKRGVPPAVISKLIEIARNPSPETRTKNSISHKGTTHIVSPEARARISESVKNLPPEVREKITDGVRAWWKKRKETQTG